MGNATAVAGSALPAYSFPATLITVDAKLNIVSGDAKGSGLTISRFNDDGAEVCVILACFTLDCVNEKVLADTTVNGQATVKQLPSCNFNVVSPLNVKYKSPLSINVREVLDKLFLTEAAKDACMAGLQLDDFIRTGVLDATDFSPLTQGKKVKLRAKPVSNKPYTVAQPAAN